MRHQSLILSFVSIVLAMSAQTTFGESGLPDPAKWNSDGGMRVFEHNAGALLSGIYREGGFNNGASPFSTNNDMTLSQPNSAQSIQATLTLLDGAATGEGFTLAPRASLEGFFYWNGTGSGSSSDRTGHVLASIALGFSPASQRPVALIFISRCNDPACNASTSLLNQSLRPVEFFQSHGLSIAYDGSRFIFQIDSDQPVVFAAPDATRHAPTVPFKALRTRLLIPASPSASGRILALYQNVAVNGVAYELFEEKSPLRVSLLPGSGSFPSTQTFDAVLVVESSEALAAARVSLNGGTILDLAALESSPLLVRGTSATGGRIYRLPAFRPDGLGPGPHIVGAEVTTVSGATGRSFAAWQVLPTTE
jgi:hypothetical protein